MKLIISDDRYLIEDIGEFFISDDGSNLISYNLNNGYSLRDIKLAFQDLIEYLKKKVSFITTVLRVDSKDKDVLISLGFKYLYTYTEDNVEYMLYQYGFITCFPYLGKWNNSSKHYIKCNGDKPNIKNKILDEERSLYHLCDAIVSNCNFCGPNDGESPLKECNNLEVNGCFIDLRYPFWHSNNLVINNLTMSVNSRAGFWYDNNIDINLSRIDGIKAFRECKNIKISNSKIFSDEAFWKCSDIIVADIEIESVYGFFEAKDVHINNLTFKGKYSFQYVDNLEINDSNLDTKDAFWHSNNVVVKNSTLKGEYLGWYSNNLTLIDCKIIGSQPLCYAKGLKLINCEMLDTDLAFEYSEVDASIYGNNISIKNPRIGKIVADGNIEIINSNSIYESKCEVVINEKNE